MDLRTLFFLVTTPLVAESVVTFNELRYNPMSDESGEWIELHNQMSINVDLSVAFAAGIDYTFPKARSSRARFI